MTRSAIARAAWPPPVLIIGAHRSGTTATARALELLGLQMGQRLDSHRESKAMQRLHETYLNKVGASWHHPSPFLQYVATAEGSQACLEYLREMAGSRLATLLGYRNNPKGWWLRARLKMGAPWGWKEPRTTLFAPFWLQLFPEACVIDVVRHPVAVALSIRQRELRFRAAGDTPNAGLDRLDSCLRLAFIYVEAGTQAAHRTSRYRRVRFETIQEDPANTLRDLAAFCGLPQDAARLVRAAGSIRAETARIRESLTPEDERAILANQAMITKLGYGIPAPGAGA